MTKDYGLSGSPVSVVHLHSVFGCDRTHLVSPFVLVIFKRRSRRMNGSQTGQTEGQFERNGIA
jgi:hypothetical protein